jgi:hypothetical protein
VLETGAIAAGFEPGDELAGKLRVKAANIIPLVMKLQIVEFAVGRIAVADGTSPTAHASC